MNRRDILLGMGAALVGATSASVVSAASAPAVLVFDETIRGTDVMPPGGSFETDVGLGVLVQRLVVSPSLDERAAVALGRLVRRIGASERCSLAGLKRLLREAWEAAS